MIRSCNAALAALVVAGSAQAGLQESLFVLDQTTGNVLVIDNALSASGNLDPNRVITTGLTIPSRTKSELAATGAEVFVATQSDVYVYNIRTGDFARSFNLGHATGGLAAGETDAFGDTLFAWNNATLYLHDATTGAELASYDFSDTFSNFSVGVAYDASTGNVVVSYLVSSGVLAWIDPDTGAVLSTADAHSRDYEGGLAYLNGTLFGSSTSNRVYTIATDGTATPAFNVNGVVISGLATIPVPGSSVVLGLAGLLVSRRRR